MHQTWVTLLVLFLASAFLAGCSGNDKGASGEPSDTSDEALGGADAPQAAPQWQVGQSWTHDWAIGGSTQFTLKSIVVANSSTEYQLATDVESTAAFAAAFFFPDIGRMSKMDWTVRDGEFAFPWYAFPLEDNKTWRGTEVNLDFNLDPVTRSLEARAAADGPGRFEIEVRDAGKLRATYDFDASTGWFTHFESYSPSPDEEPVPDLTVTTTGTDEGFVGTYYLASGEFVLNTISLVSPAAQQASPQPYATFTVGPEATHVLAILFSFAAPGASSAQLFAPDGQHWEASGVGGPDGNTVAGSPGRQLLVPAVAGEWRFATGGAGVFAAGGGGFAWAITMTTGDL